VTKMTHPVDGEKLKYLRGRRLMTQAQLSKASGVGEATIRNLERGHYSTVHASTLELLAKGLECDPSDIYGRPAEAAEGEAMTEKLADEIIEGLAYGGVFDLDGVRADLEQRDPAILAEEFGRVAALLRGLGATAEDSLGYGGELVLWEAQRHAEDLRDTCAAYAKGG
jgi:transcriptional regulator with XRE-family HTH domain